jgi:uncharacterized protein (TIGR00730 family)
MYWNNIEAAGAILRLCCFDILRTAKAFATTFAAMVKSLQSIAVFCGSSPGYHEEFREMAYAAGREIALTGARIVYGGSRLGLMGAVADGALDAGGVVTGVLPGFLKTKEIAHPGLSQLIIVDNMHERKLRMHELSDSIIALPGGWGTMEELMEMLTWAQLGLHAKPIGLLNAGGFYHGLLELIRTMQSQGFLRPALAEMLIVADEIEPLLHAMAAYKAPMVPQWITEEET